jgi:uncharacterized circularly permuted ATP-grasp superfamily protein
MHALTLPHASHHDEMLLASGAIRPHYQSFANWLHAQTPEALSKKRAEADLLFHRVGITFAVYGDDAGSRAPDPLRHHSARDRRRIEWARLQAGLVPARDCAEPLSCTTSTTARTSSRPASFRANRC